MKPADIMILLYLKGWFCYNNYQPTSQENRDMTENLDLKSQI